MNENLKPFSHYDTVLGKTVSDEKYEARTDELIIRKDKLKRFIYEGEMPFPNNNTNDFAKEQVDLENKVDAFIDMFNEWSINSPITKGSEEIFNIVFEEINKYAFFGLNFDSCRHYSIRCGVYITENEFVQRYPSYNQGRLMFYYDKEDNKHKAMFVIQEKISSIVHDDTAHFHTIVLKQDLYPSVGENIIRRYESFSNKYENFFISMMMLIKGIVIFDKEDDLEKILKV